jgi:hypothetical protein
MFRPSKKVCLNPTVHGGTEFTTRNPSKGASSEANRETLALRQMRTLSVPSTCSEFHFDEHSVFIETHGLG